jgi:hypothetical protein
VAGAQQSISLAYHLLSGRNDPEVDAILDNVILMLWPTLNPDGQNEVVAWYRRNVGTPYEASPLPDLYQEYVGHDNNPRRLHEQHARIARGDAHGTRVEPRHLLLSSQTAPFPTRIFIPPFTEPISSNIHPLMQSLGENPSRTISHAAIKPARPQTDPKHCTVARQIPQGTAISAVYVM